MKGIIEVVIRGYEKYKPRADIKDPWWFKCSNKLFDDDELYDFSLEEMAVWVYILTRSSEQKSGRVRISIRKAGARIPETLLRETIAKLVTLGIVSYPQSSSNQPETDPNGSRTDHVQDAAASRTDHGHRKGGEEKRGERKEGDARAENKPPPIQPDAPPVEEIPPPIAAKTSTPTHSPPGEDPPIQPVLDFGEGPFTVAAEIQTEPTVRFVASQIPPIRQREWLGKHGPKVFNDSLAKAIAKKLLELKTEDPRNHKDWLGYLENWFKREQVVAFVPNSGTLRPRSRVKDPPTPWPTGAKDRALGGQRVLDAFRAAGGR